jgi:hypothetical protein
VAEPRVMAGVRALFAGGLLVLLAGGAEPALAQAPGSLRPYRGLFGNATDQGARHKLDGNVSVIAAYDSDVPLDALKAGLPRPEAIGPSAILNSGLEYEWNGRYVQVEATGTAGHRYYSTLDRIRIVSGTAVVGMSAVLPARSHVEFRQTAAYTPTYLYDLFPRAGVTTVGAAPPASPDYAVDGTELYSYESSLGLAYNAEGKNSLVGTAQLNRTDARGDVRSQRDLSVYGFEGIYARRLGRRASANARYRYRVGDVLQGTTATAVAAAFVEQGAEIGMTYRWPLSATRQVTFDGRIGSAALQLPELARTTSVRRRPYRLLGDLVVAYPFGRTWHARAGYRSSIEYMAGLPEPVSTDGFTAMVEGRLPRRIDFTVSAAYSNGEATWTPNSLSFNTYTGNLHLGYSLSWSFTVFGEYLYYFYDFRGTTQLGPGIPQRLERSGLRAGVTLKVPALRSR